MSEVTMSAVDSMPLAIGAEQLPKKQARIVIEGMDRHAGQRDGGEVQRRRGIALLTWSREAGRLESLRPVVAVRGRFQG